MALDIQPFHVLSGTETLASTLEGWSLDQESDSGDPRQFRAFVAFDRPFRTAPVVHIGIVGMDASNADAARVAVSTAGINSQGFEILVSTWLHSKLWRVDVSGIAISP